MTIQDHGVGTRRRGPRLTRIAAAALGGATMVGITIGVLQPTESLAGLAQPAAPASSTAGANSVTDLLAGTGGQPELKFAKKRYTSRSRFEMSCLTAGGSLGWGTLPTCSMPNGNSAVWHGDGTFTVTYPDGMEIDY